MGKFIDMTGWKMREHGVPDSKLTVIERSDDYISSNGVHHVQWLCECGCDKHNKIVASGYDLRSGHTKSCGCLATEMLVERSKKYNYYEKRCDENGEYYVGLTTNTNKEFFFDVDDYDKIKDYCWYEASNKNKTYFFVATHIDCKNVKLHQMIAGKHVDHIDRNPFNNRKRNLRQCTHQENCWNRGAHKDGSSGFAGVCWIESSKKWRAYITINGKQKHLGCFINKDDAVKARLEAEKKYFKEFSPQNNLFLDYGVSSFSG